ncbi:MAG TPA: hypothetical protein VGF16_16705 [Bryobacteraceae bacterium]|jgi:hypothetical protein
MPGISMVLIALGALCFGFATFGVNGSPRLNILALGLFFLAVAGLVSRVP